RDDIRRDVEFELLSERENGMALAMVLLIAAVGASGMAVHAHHTGLRHNAELGFALAALAACGAAFAWIDRPGFERIEERLEDRLRSEMAAEDTGRIAPAAPASGALVCVLDADRSRVTGAVAEDVPLDWQAGGCVNGRTQYGLAGGAWARVFVPDDEESVSVNRFDPVSRLYQTERYLLDREAMARVRDARAE